MFGKVLEKLSINLSDLILVSLYVNVKLTSKSFSNWFQSAMNVESIDKPIWEINVHLKKQSRSNNEAFSNYIQITPFEIQWHSHSSHHYTVPLILLESSTHILSIIIIQKVFQKRKKKWKTPIFLFQRGFFQQNCWCFSYPFIQFFIVKSLHKHFVEFNTTISMKALNKQMRNKW